MGELYDKTLDKRKYFEDFKFSYRYILESNFDQQCESNLQMKAFVEQLDIVMPLEPSDAFYGGRTKEYTLYKEVSNEVEIEYYDFTSLYPWVNKTWKIPIGQPEIITEHFGSLDGYEGLVKFKVLPPKDLFHPVLPCKVNGKLLFHLCKACAESKNQLPCNHSDDQRAFRDTWVTDELKRVLSKRYEIIQLYEVWHFNRISQYDPSTKTGVYSLNM